MLYVYGGKLPKVYAGGKVFKPGIAVDCSACSKDDLREIGELCKPVSEPKATQAPAPAAAPVAPASTPSKSK